MYIEDSIHDSKAEWYIKGVALGYNYAVIDFLSPGVKYRAYMVQATEIGNGPPSEKFYFVAKPARKYIYFCVIVFVDARQKYVTVNIQSLYLFTGFARSRGGSRTAATSKMERFMIIVNGWKPLTIITKSSILDVAAVLDPPL